MKEGNFFKKNLVVLTNRAVITRYRLYEANGLCRVTNSLEVNTSLEGNLVCTSGFLLFIYIYI